MIVNDVSGRYSPHGKGYVKVYRKLLTSAVFQDEGTLKVWMWCLLRANYEPRPIDFAGEEIELQKGQFITGRIHASAELAMSESRTWRLLKKLQHWRNISIKSNNKFSVITIVNYDSYQSDDSYSGQPADNQRTTSGQPADTDNKLINKETKKLYADTSPPYRLASHLYQRIILNDPNFHQPNLQAWAKHTDALLRLDGRSVDEITAVIDFCQQDNFWKSNILSTKKLREKFTSLKLRMNTNGKSKRSGSQADRASFEHTAADEKRLRELHESCRESRLSRERD